VEQGKPVEPYSTGREEITTFEGRLSGFGHPERTGALREIDLVVYQSEETVIIASV
jgi:hypothetical protein